MKALNNHSPAAQQSAFSSLQSNYSQTQNRRNDRSSGSEVGYDSRSAYEAMSAEDLPGVGLGQSFQQSMEGFDTHEQSAGVADVIAERQRRLQADISTQMVGGSIRTQARGRTPAVHAAQTPSRLEAYRARFQAGRADSTSSVRSRSEFEARMEERMEALMALHGISANDIKDPEIKLPVSPWDVEFQRSEAASAMGYKQYNYSTHSALEALPRVGI